MCDQMTNSVVNSMEPFEEPFKNWRCCRTCLSVHNLNPIFARPEHSEKYSKIILCCTGIKVQLNDCLSQLMCTKCITFINNSYKFRKKCEEAQNLLIERLNKKTYNIKTENIKTEENILKSDTVATLDITDLLTDNDISDYDDNITLSNYYIEIENIKQEKIIQNVETVTGNADNYSSSAQLGVKDSYNNDSSSKDIKNKSINKERTARKGKTKEENQEEQGTNEQKEGVKEEIRCELCDKIFNTKRTLRHHKQKHAGYDVVCEHCGKKFITRGNLLTHCKAKHGYEKTDKCSYCDYKASNAEQVKIHERLHTGEKPYACTQCDARFHRNSSYLQHVAIHLPEKTVQCDECPARFKSTTLMRIHRMRHRDLYTYTCRVCRNTFRRRWNVVRHLQRIHSLQPDAEHIERIKRTL